MKQHSTTYILSKEKLRHLLKMGLRHPRSKSVTMENKQAQLWHNLLSRPLPLDKPQLETLPVVLADFCHTLGLLAGPSLQGLLQDPSTEVSVIENIKLYAKDLSRQSQSQQEHTSANTLYYAAIAHALLYHQRKITAFGYQDLGKAFSELQKLKWVDEKFRCLFKEACEYCNRKTRP